MRADEIVGLIGANACRPDGAWSPAVLTNSALRRRPIADRAAA